MVELEPPALKVDTFKQIQQPLQIHTPVGNAQAYISLQIKEHRFPSRWFRQEREAAGGVSSEGMRVKGGGLKAQGGPGKIWAQKSSLDVPFPSLSLGATASVFQDLLQK